MVSLFYYYNIYFMAVNKLSIWQKIQTTTILILLFFIGLIALVYALSLLIRDRKKQVKEKSDNKQKRLKSRASKAIRSNVKNKTKTEETPCATEELDETGKEQEDCPCFSDISTSLFVDEESDEVEEESEDGSEEESEESKELEEESVEESKELEEQYALRVYTANDSAGLIDFRDNEFKLKNYSIVTESETPARLSKGESVKIEAKSIISIDFGINFEAPVGYRYVLHDNKTLIEEKCLVPLMVITEGLSIKVMFMALKDVDIAFDDELYTCRFVKE